MNEFIITIDDKKITIKKTSDNEVIVDGKKYSCELSKINGHSYLLKLNNKVYELSADRISEEKFNISLNGMLIETIARTTLQEKATKIIEQRASQNHKMEVKAPMPGMILKIKKNTGDAVVQSESVIILEAMKMENDLRSPVSGKIKQIYVKEGNAVEKGAILFEII